MPLFVTSILIHLINLSDHAIVTDRLELSLKLVIAETLLRTFNILLARDEHTSRPIAFWCRFKLENIFSFIQFIQTTRRSGYEKEGKEKGKGKKLARSFVRTFARVSSLCITSHTLLDGCCVPCFFGVGQDRRKEKKEVLDVVVACERVLFTSHSSRLCIANENPVLHFIAWHSHNKL